MEIYLTKERTIEVFERFGMEANKTIALTEWIKKRNKMSADEKENAWKRKEYATGEKKEEGTLHAPVKAVSETEEKMMTTRQLYYIAIMLKTQQQEWDELDLLQNFTSIGAADLIIRALKKNRKIELN